MPKIHRWKSTSLSSPDQLLRAEQKALDSGADACWIQLSDWNRLSQETRARFKWFVEVSFRAWRDGATYKQTPPFKWVVVADGNEKDLSAWSLTSEPNSILLIRPQDVRQGAQWISRLTADTAANTFFEFLPWRPEFPNRATVKEIRRFIDQHKAAFPESPMRTLKGLESWDDRLDSNLEVEPLNTPDIQFQMPQEPELSVVIPTHNNSKFITSVLRALLQQTLERHRYEILLVDDGSTDDTRSQVQRLIGPEKLNLGFSYFFMPRPSERKSGDNHYRAGIARNLGAKRARGQSILFLDSDILVSPDFLNALLREQHSADVIQCERHHIKAGLCNKPMQYTDVKIGQDTFIEEANYWGPFFKTENWMGIDHFWKYTCTYALLIKRSDFAAVGGFKRTFTTYGFEDVDLGYELHQLGRTFRLLHEKTLHLTPERTRSEYNHSPWIRQNLLARTAKIFFRQHLDPTIYDMLRIFMGESAWLPRLRWRWKNDKSAERPQNVAEL